MRVVYFISLMLFLSACSDLEESITNQTVYDEFEMFEDLSPTAAYHMKKFFIGYFIDIALGSEFGDKAPVSKKWLSEMKVFVVGQANDALQNELVSIIDEINEFATDGFQISIVENFEDANFYVYFTSSKEYAERYSYLLDLIKDNKGLFTTFHDEDFNIYKGHMYVDTKRAVLGEQLHLLREEFTQALGLGNDIPHHFESIFYNGFSRTTAYSENDKNVIKLLYHPALISGLGDESIKGALEALLGV